MGGGGVKEGGEVGTCGREREGERERRRVREIPMICHVRGKSWMEEEDGGMQNVEEKKTERQRERERERERERDGGTYHSNHD